MQLKKLVPQHEQWYINLLLISNYTEFYKATCNSDKTLQECNQIKFLYPDTKDSSHFMDAGQNWITDALQGRRKMKEDPQNYYNFASV